MSCKHGNIRAYGDVQPGESTPGDGETAKQVLRDILRNFPGFIADEEVNGGDLVDYINECIPDIEKALGGRIAARKLMVCADCSDVVAGDAANLDADRLGEIETAITALGGALHSGDGYEEFSARACELCGSKLGGTRHQVAHLKGGTI